LACTCLALDLASCTMHVAYEMGLWKQMIIRLSTTGSSESEYETPHVLLSTAPTKRIRMVPA